MSGGKQEDAIDKKLVVRTKLKYIERVQQGIKCEEAWFENYGVDEQKCNIENREAFISPSLKNCSLSWEI